MFRAKAAEIAFFDVYKQLADVGDPVPILEHALESQKSLAKLADYEIETNQLRETIQDYNEEIQAYKAKEKKLAELQTKVDAYDRNIDETLNSRIKDASERMMEEYNEKLRLLEEDKTVYERRNAEMAEKLRSAQKQLAESQAELFEAQSKRDEKRNAEKDEVEILLNDMETANERAADAERENEVLRDQVGEMKAKMAELESQSATAETAESPALSRELASKEREVKQLMDELERVKSEKSKDDAVISEERSERAVEKERNETLIRELEAKLAAQADYDAIKRDLNILTSHDFPQDKEGSESGNKRPLEVVILEKSKVLQNENSTLRIERDRLSQELTDVKDDLATRKRELEKSEKLCSELEDHVARLQDISRVNRGEAEGRSSADILVDLVPGSRSSFDEVFEYDDKLAATANASPALMNATDPELESMALLPIVQAQRERFRQRNEVLEEERSNHLNQLVLMQKEVKDLQSDNVKLYEKIKYLQGYGGSNKRPDTAVIPVVESRYKSGYEQKLDPFSSFNHAERQRRYGQLNVFEKIILSFVQIIMGNKFARLFVFGYSVLLHMLVFLVLMKLAYSDSYRRDLASEWHEKYTQHMADAHDEHNVG